MENQKQFSNVREPWEIYDTLLVNPSTFGQESAVQGWFRSLLLFAGQETHTFFKLRSEGNSGGSYNNQQSIDTMDYAFYLYSIGISFFSVGTRYLAKTAVNQINQLDTFSAHFWESELPAHCAFQFKVNQDIVSEGPALDYAPGYGPVGGGAGSQVFAPNTFINYAACQGEPVISARHKFEKPLGIPRTATIEGVLWVSPYMRAMLSVMGGPYDYLIPKSGEATTVFNVPKVRYGIQVSLMGTREVQQRGQYHR